jgi:hypothetical protein
MAGMTNLVVEVVVLVSQTLMSLMEEDVNVMRQCLTFSVNVSVSQF